MLKQKTYEEKHEKIERKSISIFILELLICSIAITVIGAVKKRAIILPRIYIYMQMITMQLLIRGEKKEAKKRICVRYGPII